MQFKGEHFLQPWRAALDNKACDQAALSYLSLDHSLKVGAPPAPWLWSCPAQRAPPQGRLGVLCAKGVNRQEFPGSRLAPFLIASLSPIAQESAQAGSRTRGGGRAGGSASTTIPYPLHALLLRLKNSTFTGWWVQISFPFSTSPSQREKALLIKLRTLKKLSLP